eukprot:CAMPEP_0182418372 /NCGR_PEP_ID=MMETSP1167-20130531/2823_1 /TAXON_ID=2988 /ORGANISM="Mallomonas Sp, Strain CCMP3275" /LENGTH=443 /DNA_ID=CAMNT_0024592555 /DNA_START=68 /DNA_END=1399 /DNA_ORIENTATION=+
MISSVLVLACILVSVSGFTWMANIKMPKISSFSNYVEAMKFGDKKLVVITGTSSGLGKQTAKQLIEQGGYYVICGVRDVDKMKTVAEVEEFNPANYHIMEVDLASFDSVRKFAKDIVQFKAEKPLDRLVCNAAVYQPSLNVPQLSEDGHEQQIQINYLSHFLLISLLMPEMKGAADPRVITVGSVTGNDNTVGGGGVYPVADLRDLEGLEVAAMEGEKVIMMDGYNFNGAKGYKDSKLALMMTTNELHDRYHKSTGISFSSIYPGCIAASPLFREKRPWFRKYFPLFMKYITGGFVGEEEAGSRLYQVIADPRCTRSGVYWSWNGGPRQGRGMDALKNGGDIVGAGGAGGGWDSIFENDPSDKVLDRDLADRLWKYSSAVTRADWPLARQPKSPCPTLKVISTVTSILDKKEEIELQQRRKAREERRKLLGVGAGAEAGPMIA